MRVTTQLATASILAAGIGLAFGWWIFTRPSAGAGHSVPSPASNQPLASTGEGSTDSNTPPAAREPAATETAAAAPAIVQAARVSDIFDDTMESPPSPSDGTDVARRKLIKRMVRELRDPELSKSDRLIKLRTAMSLSIATIMDKAGTSIRMPDGEKFHPKVDDQHVGFMNGDGFYRFRPEEFPEYPMIWEYTAHVQSGPGADAGVGGQAIEFDEVLGLVMDRARQALPLIADAR